MNADDIEALVFIALPIEMPSQITCLSSDAVSPPMTVARGDWAPQALHGMRRF